MNENKIPRGAAPWSAKGLAIDRAKAQCEANGGTGYLNYYEKYLPTSQFLSVGGCAS